MRYKKPTFSRRRCFVDFYVSCAPPLCCADIQPCSSAVVQSHSKQRFDFEFKFVSRPHLVVLQYSGARLQYTGLGFINGGAAYFRGGTVLCCTATQPRPSNESGAGGTGGGIKGWGVWMLLILGSGAFLD